ncbi:hypothetical protein F4556_003310 [Kitasatospora gansuensis]|uniref:Uncharacterized protein n=1 Tax=Kitasatospora gansuensis TaxID=258050 RepID=A0A7W7WIF2_9ACTN|nr:hypothetical protein [Kitasatospora gansuensis]MBB4947775.1 hypothetical protein [Kitasatospora gansuensis]
MSTVEFYPDGFWGLHWEAAAPPDDDGDVDGFVLAVMADRRIALANVASPGAVVVGTPAELTALRDALNSDQLGYLLAGVHQQRSGESFES